MEPALVCLSGAEMCGSAKTLMPATLHSVSVIDNFLQSLLIIQGKDPVNMRLPTGSVFGLNYKLRVEDAFQSSSTSVMLVSSSMKISEENISEQPYHSPL